MNQLSSSDTYMLAVTFPHNVCRTTCLSYFSAIHLSFECIMALVNPKICSSVLGKMPPIELKTLATYFGRDLVSMLAV